MLDLRKSAKSGIATEFSGAKLGDVRRTRRLQRIAERAMQAPEVGFPRMVGDDSELEGIYRFFNNEEILAEDVVGPHVTCTFERMRKTKSAVLVVHDTTDLRFGGLHTREGLGPTYGKQQGFLLHLALAVMPGEERVTLGSCGMLHIVRTGLKKTRSKSWYEMSKDPTRESLRWGQLVEQIESKAGKGERIHLMDREGDNYDLFALMLRLRSRAAFLQPSMRQPFAAQLAAARGSAVSGDRLGSEPARSPTDSLSRSPARGDASVSRR